MEERIERVEERLSNLETEHKALAEKINTINTDRAVQNTKLDSIMKSLEEIKKDIADVKAKPAQRWDSIVSSIIRAIGAGIVGAVFGYMQSKGA